MTKARDIASAIPAPSTVSSAELGFLDGVTSAIQTQLDAKTAKSTLTTTGDIYYASAANTPARLGIGSSAQVLTVAAGVPSWATPSSGSPAIAQIATGNINSGTSVTISSLSSYDTLILRITGVTWDTGGDALFFQINGTNSSHTYITGTNRTTESMAGSNSNEGAVRLNGSEGQLRTNSASTYIIVFENCKAAGFTNFQFASKFNNDGNNVNTGTYGTGIFTSAAAVSSIVIFTGELYTFNGSGTYTIYGG